MNVRYTRRACAEREAIYDYREAQNPEGALNVKRCIAQAVRALALFPGLRRPTDLLDVRELIVPRYPYKIYHRVDGDDVWILHLRDARRRPLETG
jgi:toxin ParE1/3/4